MNIKHLFHILLTAVILIGMSVCATADDDTGNEKKVVELAPVMFHGRELFKVVDISAVNAHDRADGLVRRLERKAKSPLFNTNDLTIFHD